MLAVINDVPVLYQAIESIEVTGPEDAPAEEDFPYWCTVTCMSGRRHHKGFDTRDEAEAMRKTILSSISLYFESFR